MKKTDKNRLYARIRGKKWIVFPLLLLLPATPRAQEEQQTFTFFCQAGSTALVESAANQTASRSLHRILCDTTLRIHGVQLLGTASIEGDYHHNALLAQRRVHALFRQLEEEYHLSARRIRVTQRSIPEHWDELARNVSHSTMLHRHEVLSIIRQVPITQGREHQLMQLAGGAPYRLMKQRFFPGLRQMRVTLTFSRKHLPGQTTDDVRTTNSPNPEETTASVPTKAQDTLLSDGTSSVRFRPHLLLKTNLLAWAGITPEIAFRTPMPNLEVELRCTPHFALHLAALYQEGVGHARGYNLYHVSGYTLEGRYRPLPTLRHPGCYLGLYLRAGDYNMRPVPGEGITGAYSETGLSIGYTVALSAHWLLEGGVSAGYRYTHIKTYLHDAHGDHPTGRRHTDAFRLTNLSLAIGYRL
ncbi:MAG: DUF3575 domain-containing protein [Prevotellaceae bacterium]|jgi:hypothetical protein|nr:DUF3575 domain-containing protein [Prevotellaceae bacterium]